MEIKIAPPKRTIITLLLALSILPVSLALGAPLPGPLLPAPPPIPTPPTTGYDTYTILQAPAGNPDQSVLGTLLNEMIAEYGNPGTDTQYISGETHLHFQCWGYASCDYAFAAIGLAGPVRLFAEAKLGGHISKNFRRSCVTNCYISAVLTHHKKYSIGIS